MAYLPRDRRLGIQEFVARALVVVLDSQSRETREHCERVAALCSVMASWLNLPEERRRRLNTAALVHDVGKLQIPLPLLEKPGPLSPEELAAVREHVRLGVEYLRRLGIFEPELLRIVEEHHEAWDGSGYPAGRKGEGISLEGQVLALADWIDGVMSGRPYHPPRPAPQVLEMLREEQGRRFSPELLAGFGDRLRLLIQEFAGAGTSR
jgi:putative nucleotidyltransferase with HDIG domain